MRLIAARNGQGPIETCRIRWTQGRAHVPCEVKRYGKRIGSEEVVDFRRLGVPSFGMLGQTLESLALPCHLKRFRKFNDAISILAKDAHCRDILSKPLESLSTRHIVSLFDKHEQYLKADGAWANPAALAVHFRAYFRRNTASLGCGSLVSDVEFRSLLNSRRQVEKVKLISEAFDASSPEGFRAPISALPHSDLADLDGKAKLHLEIRLDRITEACWTTLAEHESLAASIRLGKARDLPDFGERFANCRPLAVAKAGSFIHRIVILKRAGVDDQDIATYVWHWLEVAGLPRRPDQWGKASWPLSQATGIAPCSGGRVSAYFSDYFLSQTALLACQYLLQIHGGWNPDTVRALTANEIQRESDGSITIRPFKSKSNQYLLPKHFGKQEKVHGVIELLLAHRANVDRFELSNDSSLFVGYQPQLKVFGLFNPKTAHKWLLKKHALAPFAPSQLRDQKANSVYMNSQRDVLQLKEYLGHADLQTVDTYLNHSIQRVLSAANLAEFTRRLDLAIQWMVDAAPRPDDPNTARLLFPIDDARRDSRCDVWLDDDGPIAIGPEEIAHCVWQKAYYVRNFERLRSENPRRFALVHIPRIVFCVALFHLILQSPYRYLVSRFEAQVPADSRTDA